MGQNVRRLLDGPAIVLFCFYRRFEKKKKSEEDKRKLLVGHVRGLRDDRSRPLRSNGIIISCGTIKVIQWGHE